MGSGYSGFVRLPSSAAGLRWYCPISNHHWGTPRLVNKILTMGRQTSSTIRCGDMSLPRGGRFPPHATHRDGRACDFLPMGGTYRNQQFVNLMYAGGGVSFVLYNDRRVRGVRPAPGHGNHLHMQIR